MCMRAMVGRGSVIRVTVRMYFLTKVSFWMDPGVPTFTDYLLYLFTLIVIVFHLPFFFFFFHLPFWTETIWVVLPSKHREFSHEQKDTKVQFRFFQASVFHCAFCPIALFYIQAMEIKPEFVFLAAK